jgi:hypothetical protein
MSKKPRPLLFDAVATDDLEQKARAWLAANPEPDNEFDRVGREALQRYIDMLDKLRAKATKNDDPTDPRP